MNLQESHESHESHESIFSSDHRCDSPRIPINPEAPWSIVIGCVAAMAVNLLYVVVMVMQIIGYKWPPRL